MAKERLSLYFDTDIPVEKKIWDYICKDGRNRKSYNVKKALEMVINEVDFKPLMVTSNDIDSINNPIIIKTNNDDDISQDEMPF